MLVLVLDRTHAVLTDDVRAGAPGCALPDIALADDRPMRAVAAAFTARGITLGWPAGSRARADGHGRDFAFVIERTPAPPGMSWRPLRDVVATDDTAWDLYVTLLLGGHIPATRALDVWAFGNRPEMAALLVHLVMCGEKRVTMGWIEASQREGTPLAYEGGISVVTDGFGYPRVILRSSEVREIPFGDIDAATAAGEGEGDLTHADWRESHVDYFTKQAATHGLTFDDRALIAVERFEVLHVIGRA